MKRNQLLTSCLFIGLIGILSGCQGQGATAAYSSDSHAQDFSSTFSNSVSASALSAADTSDVSDPAGQIKAAFAEKSFFSEEQGFAVSQAPWGCSLEEMGIALAADFYEPAVLSGPDCAAYLSSKPVTLFGAEAAVQAEVYEDQVSALSFRFEAHDDLDTIYTILKDNLSSTCDTPARESDSDFPQKIIIWEQNDTSLALVRADQEIRINLGQNLDTTNINPVELKAEDLKNDSGEYGLSSLPWGSDTSAAPEALGIRFYEIPTLWNETLAAYPSRDSSNILGCAARVVAEYHEDGGLYQLTFTLSTTDSEAAFNDLLTQLQSQYGNDFTQTENADANRTACRWGATASPGTALILGKTGETVTIDLVQF